MDTNASGGAIFADQAPESETFKLCGPADFRVPSCRVDKPSIGASEFQQRNRVLISYHIRWSRPSDCVVCQSAGYKMSIADDFHTGLPQMPHFSDLVAGRIRCAASESDSL